MIQRTKPFSLSVCALAAGLLVSACGGGEAEPPPDRFPPTVTITDNVSAATATGPIPASKGALKKAGWKADDLDLIEANRHSQTPAMAQMVLRA